MILFWSVLLGCYLLDVSYPILSDALDGKWSRASGHGRDRRTARVEHGPRRPGYSGSRGSVGRRA